MTNAEWQAFLDDPEVRRRMEEAERPMYVPRETSGPIPPANLGGPTAPVMGVSWRDAIDYVAWRNARAEAAGEPWVYDLPGEDEWEKAARGVDGRAFPWGDRFDFGLAVSLHRKPQGLYDAPGGFEPRDESPYGVQDLAGGRQEWTRDRFPGDEQAGAIYRMRGGSWRFSREELFRAASRHYAREDYAGGITGFRLVARPRDVER